MMRLLFFISTQLFFINTICGQGWYQNKDACLNHIATKSTFVIVEDGVAVDKRLTFKEEFNVAGYPLSQTINLDEEIVIVSESRRYNRAIEVLGIAGELNLKKGDTVKVDSYTDQNGLALYATESINGELQSKVVYEYVFRKK